MAGMLIGISKTLIEELPIEPLVKLEIGIFLAIFSLIFARLSK